MRVYEKGCVCVCAGEIGERLSKEGNWLIANLCENWELRNEAKKRQSSI